MKPQQAHCVGPRRSQHPADRRRSYLRSGEGLTAGGELFGRQRYEAPLAFSVGTQMHSLAAAVEYEVAIPHLQSAVFYRRTFARRKRNKYTRRQQRDISDARQIFAATKHMETTQVQARQTR